MILPYFPTLLRCLALLLAAAFSLSATAGPDAATPNAAPTALSPGRSFTYSFADLGAGKPLALRSVDGSSSISFGLRGDEIVTHAHATIRYSYSPALIPQLSHIKVYFNDQLLTVLPTPAEGAGKPQVQEVDLDPRYFTGYNTLRLQLIGHYTMECENPFHSSLWADIGNDSSLSFTVQPLAIAKDLGLFPEPFFDVHDSHRLLLPFVFAPGPDLPTLQVAGELASWFGALAAWRGARFPAMADGSLPKRHGIVLATNDRRPDFLALYPKVNAPTIAVIANPANADGNLLLILGRNAEDLRTAVDAVVLGQAVLTGPSTTVTSVRLASPRKPYDAPNWVRLDRPTKLGELVESPQALQVGGYEPAPIRLTLHLPADLFTWRSEGIPLTLKYRYTPPPVISDSRLNIDINREFLKSFNLRGTGEGGDAARVRVPLLQDALLGDSNEFFIPAFKLGANNELAFQYSFGYANEGKCMSTPPDNMRGAIDADSTIDFSNFPHYAAMPNLRFFVDSGFPFTRLADLAETTVVLPSQPQTQDIESMLTLLGTLGASTGYPALRYELAQPQDIKEGLDRDLLVVGAAPGQSLLATWRKGLAAFIDATHYGTAKPVRGVNLLYNWLGFETDPNPAVQTQVETEGPGPLGALIGFESPLKKGRSVVAVTANSTDRLPLVLDAMADSGKARHMEGSVAFVRDGGVKSYLVGETYYVGSLPFLTLLWYHLSEHPLWLAVMAVLAVLVFGFALSRMLRARAAHRLER